MTVYRTITMWQPQASLVADGFTEQIVRGWGTDYRGPVAIHATKFQPKDFDPEQVREAMLCEGWLAGIEAHLKDMAQWPRGVILATCHLLDCQRITDDRDALRPLERVFASELGSYYRWTLSTVTKLVTTIPMGGDNDVWECRLGPEPCMVGAWANYELNRRIQIVAPPSSQTTLIPALPASQERIEATVAAPAREPQPALF